MTTWHPISEKPPTVGQYLYADSAMEFRAQWDGRQFRYADSGEWPDWMVGAAITPCTGDEWRELTESEQ